MSSHMPEKPYTVYRSGGLRARRSLRRGCGCGGDAGAVIATEAAAASGANLREAATSPQDLCGLRRKRHAAGTLSRLLKWTSLLALFCGLGLIAWAGFAFGRSYLEARAGQSELRSEFSVSGNGSVDPGYLQQQAAAMQARLQKLDPVGEISIPGIGAHWMIVEGSDEDAFRKGPGHIEDTQFPGAGGNFVVAGDRVLYGAPFLKLNELQAGDLIKVKMPYATFAYRVTETFKVSPDDVSVLELVGYEAITLITCDPPWDVKQRIVVRGQLDEVQPAGTDI